MRNSINVFFKTLKKYKFSIIIYLLMKFLLESFTVINPYVLGKFIDNLIQENNKYILWCIIIISCVLLVSCIVEYLTELIFTRLNLNVNFDFKMKIYNSLHNININYLERKKHDYITNRINTDVNIVSNFFFNFVIPISVSIIKFIIFLYLMLMINKVITSILICIFMLNLIVYLVFKNKLYKKRFLAVETQNQFYADQNNMIFNLRNIKRNSWVCSFNNIIKQSFNNFFKENYSLKKILTLYSKTQLIIKLISYASLLYFSSIYVLQNKMTVGDFTVFMTYYNSSYQIILGFLTFGSSYQELKVANNRINEYLIQYNVKENNKQIDNIQNIELNDICFKYGNEKIITNFSYKFKKGNIYYICGDNGSGKTTLIDLIIGVNKGYKGYVSYNNILIDEINLSHLKKNKIAYMEQKPELIVKNNIKDNILFGINHYSHKKMDYYCDKFNIVYDNRLLEDNNNLSGGEKQKIALIRTLLKNADLIILDEPTSALDSQGINSMIELIEEEKKDKIIIIISHDKRLLANNPNIIHIKCRRQNVKSKSII